MIWSREARIRRRLRTTKLYRVADLPDGVDGRVVGRTFSTTEPLKAPLTGRPCLCFVATVERYLGREMWRKIITETGSTPFGFTDDSGRAIVVLTAAQLLLELDRTSRSGPWDTTAAQEALLRRHGRDASGIWFNKRLRYREAIIGIGEEITIVGSGIREPDPDAPPAEAYRGEPATRLRLTSSSAHRLVISDSREANELLT